MSGQVDDIPVHVRIAYSGPWTDDDARRLIRDPMLLEMAQACNKIADQYRSKYVEVSLV